MADGDPREQLRLALVMTGGVSLAVWMGGVTTEIYRACHDHGFYQRLLDEMNRQVLVDIVTGSSAGGLNGAFLAAAESRDLSVPTFDGLRDVWMEAGSFSQLLRDPLKKNPPSLLKGDEYFRPEMDHVLRAWLNNGPNTLGTQKLDLILTATTLAPELLEYPDDLGALLHEPVHRAQFRFDSTDFDTPEIDEANLLADQLALAARTTASFPGAFEASYVPVNEQVAGLPDMAGVASFTSSRWAIDGGVLVNEPVGLALEVLAERKYTEQGRRLLLYVNPDPSGQASQPPSNQGEEPTIFSVVMQALVGLPRVESVAADLSELRTRSNAFDDQARIRDRLLTQPDRLGAPLEVIATGAFTLWSNDHQDELARRRVEHYLTLAKSDIRLPVPGAVSAGDYTWKDLSDALRDLRSPLGPFPRPTEILAEERWRDGYDALDYFSWVVLDLLTMAFENLDTSTDARRVPLQLIRDRVVRVREATALLRDLDTAYWDLHLAGGPVSDEERSDRRVFAQRLTAEWPRPPGALFADDRPLPVPTTTRTRPAYCDLWRRFATFVARRFDPEDERTVPPTSMAGARGSSTLDETDYRTTPEELRGLVQQREGELARVVAQALLDLSNVHATIVADDETAKEGTDRARRARRRRLKRLLDALISEAPTVATAESTSVEDHPDAGRLRLHHALPSSPVAPLDVFGVLARLLALFVIHSLTEDIDASSYRADFVQISAEGDSPIDPGRIHPVDKVAGLQLAHFGAFLKESWRANDWMWGRLDGARGLIASILEPGAVRSRFANAHDAIEAMHRVVIAPGANQTAGDPDTLEALWAASESAMTEELAKLFDAPELGPPAIPATTRLLQLVAQLLIAQEELPEVGAAITRSERDGGAMDGTASRFVDALEAESTPLSLAGARTLFPRCAVGRETIGGEVGSDLLTQTATTAAAVATTALAGQSSGVGFMRGLFSTLRSLVLLIWVVVQGALRRSRTAFALTQGLFTFAIAVLVVRWAHGQVSTALMVVAVTVLLTWLVITVMTVGASRLLLVLAPIVVLVCWASLNQCDGITLFSHQTNCVTATGTTTVERDGLHHAATWLPLLAGACGLLSAGFYWRNWLHQRRELTAVGVLGRLNESYTLFRTAAAAFVAAPTSGKGLETVADQFLQALDLRRRPARHSRNGVVESLAIGAAAAAALRWALDRLPIDVGWLARSTKPSNAMRLGVGIVGLIVASELLILLFDRRGRRAERRRRPRLTQWLSGLWHRLFAPFEAKADLRWWRFEAEPRLDGTKTRWWQRIPGARRVRQVRAEAQRARIQYAALDLGGVPTTTTTPAPTPPPPPADAGAMKTAWSMLKAVGPGTKRVARALAPWASRHG